MSGHSVFETHRVYIDAADMVQRIAAGLALDGLVTFECDPERDAVLALALRLLIPWQHRGADPDGITLICDREALARRRGPLQADEHAELSLAAGRLTNAILLPVGMRVAGITSPSAGGWRIARPYRG
jgi:hypothetical protein